MAQTPLIFAAKNLIAIFVRKNLTSDFRVKWIEIDCDVHIINMSGNVLQELINIDDNRYDTIP